jgi:hypothetical protein
VRELTYQDPCGIFNGIKVNLSDGDTSAAQVNQLMSSKDDYSDKSQRRKSMQNWIKIYRKWSGLRSIAELYSREQE